MILTCGTCGRKHPLTEDDAVYFHPRFFCLSCGGMMPISMDETTLVQLRAKTDRDRRLPNSVPLPSRQTVRHVKKEGDGEQGTCDG